MSKRNKKTGLEARIEALTSNIKTAGYIIFTKARCTR